MAKCRTCGKQTMGDFQYCIQCSSAQRGGGQTERRPQAGSSPRLSRPESAVPGFGADYLKEGYFSGEYLREELYTSEAVRVADVLSAKGMSRASLRRFYNKLRGIYARFKDAKNFEEIKPALYSFYPNVADAVSRNNNVPEEFRQFINKNIRLAATDPKHLNAFVEHFQSVLAYFKETGGRR